MTPIATTADLEVLCKDLASAEFLTVDTEFMREQTYYPNLCLIQVAGPEHEATIDPLSPQLDLKPFWELMAAPDQVKVFHAARQDLEIFHILGGLIPRPVFDTQVAAMVCGFGDQISYVNLVRSITGAELDKSSRFTDWSKRPLSDKQLQYAIGDVTHLRDVYRRLSAQLAKTGRESWLNEEMATLTDPATYQQDPELAWQRLKLKVKNRRALAVLMSLAAWRERAAQKQNVPRQRIMRDDALYDIANQSPRSTADLGNLRSLPDGFSRSSRAKDIVTAVEEGLARDVANVPALRQGQPLTAEATATLELLKVLLKAAAARHGVAPRMIADASDLEELARHAEADTPALKGWRRELFGADALSLKRGELALTLKDGDVVVMKVE
ncbi:MAG: ribonuclease D [Alphaproteobacteria bacterium BRH_c36]|nr:MAG: ribonuclease D [Alphaproteobacteria bacterium BRH_c36]